MNLSEKTNDELMKLYEITGIVLSNRVCDEAQKRRVLEGKSNDIDAIQFNTHTKINGLRLDVVRELEKRLLNEIN